MRSKGIPSRLTELTVVVGLVIAALIWSESAAWRQISGLRAGMTVEHIAWFRSADQIRAAILELQSEWRRMDESTNRTDRGEVDVMSRKVTELLASLVSGAQSPTEQGLAAELSAAFPTYSNGLKNSLTGVSANRLCPFAGHDIQ